MKTWKMLALFIFFYINDFFIYFCKAIFFFPTFSISPLVWPPFLVSLLICPCLGSLTPPEGGKYLVPKLRFFRYYQKLVHETFQVFYLKLKQHKGLKLTWMVFWELCFEVFGLKWALSLIYKSQYMKLFWFFA